MKVIVKCDIGNSFWIFKNTVFGNQDTESCPESFLTEAYNFGPEISEREAQDLGLDWNTILKMEEHDSVYGEDDDIDYGSGDRTFTSFHVMSEDTVFDDDAFTLDCPEDCVLVEDEDE